jgi:toxin-antitoxin system PIN domain toxin
MRSLLDTSVLISLLDANHIHHRLTAKWLQTHGQAGWASCPITLNGCIRILSQPSYPNRLPMQTVVEGLRQAMQNPLHEFWADDVNPATTAAIDWAYTVRPVQLTDVYLLALAVAHDARFVTQDQGIALACVPQARGEQLVVLGV